MKRRFIFSLRTIFVVTTAFAIYFALIGRSRTGGWLVTGGLIATYIGIACMFSAQAKKQQRLFPTELNSDAEGQWIVGLLLLIWGIEMTLFGAVLSIFAPERNLSVQLPASICSTVSEIKHSPLANPLWPHRTGYDCRMDR